MLTNCFLHLVVGITETSIVSSYYHQMTVVCTLVLVRGTPIVFDLLIPEMR